MMAGLLYKELIINRKNIRFGIIIIIFFSLFICVPVDMENDEIIKYVYQFVMIFMCSQFFMIGGIWQQIFFSSDERKKWCDYITSTPVSVKGHVLSKYYFSLLVSIALLIHCTVVFEINAVIQGSDSGIMSVAVIMFTVQTFLRAVEYPFVVRFGSKSGNNFRAAIFSIIVLIVFIYFLFGDLSIFGTYDEFMEWFMKLMSGQIISDEILLVTAIAPFVAGVLYYFSYRISCRLYLKGAENYDK